jgi:exopolysaccharide biosynthesis protein
VKKSFLAIFISLLGNLLIAQNFDSLAVVKGNWKTDTLAEGLLLKNLSISDNSLFNSNQNIYIVEIDENKNDFFFKLAASTTLTKTSEFCKINKAFVAINGSFFFMKSGIPTDYLRVNGKKIASNTYKDGKRKTYKNGLLAIQNGHLPS